MIEKTLISPKNVSDAFDVYIAYDRKAGAEFPCVVQALCCSYGYSAFHLGNLIDEYCYDSCLHGIISRCRYFVVILTDGIWDGDNAKHVLWQIREAISANAEIVAVRPYGQLCLWPLRMTGRLLKLKDKRIVDLSLKDDGKTILSMMGIPPNHQRITNVVKSHRSIKTAREFIEQYAEYGLPSSECAMGCIMYRAGERELAKQWLTRAAEHGDVVAMLNLGKSALELNCHERFCDYWLRKAVSCGCAPAESFLAFCVGNGWYDGMIKDSRQQLYYINESAKHGCGGAMYWLAESCVDWNWANCDRPKKWRFDLKRACYWWRKAISAGCFEAAYHLAWAELGMYAPLKKDEWYWHDHEGFNEWRLVVSREHHGKNNLEKALKRAKRLLTQYLDCIRPKDRWDRPVNDVSLFLARIHRLLGHEDEAMSWYEKAKSSGWYAKGEELQMQ